jgi:hypothetical protein
VKVLQGEAITLFNVSAKDIIKRLQKNIGVNFMLGCQLDQDLLKAE